MYFNYFVTVLAEMLKFRQHMCSCERYHMEISCKVDEYGADNIWFLIRVCKDACTLDVICVGKEGGRLRVRYNGKASGITNKLVFWFTPEKVMKKAQFQRLLKLSC